jgi:molybdate transport system ATP-binding protein
VGLLKELFGTRQQALKELFPAVRLATEQPRGLSARNVIEGKITSLERRGTIVIVRVDCGVTFLAHVTPGAVRSLELTAGRKVWLVLKTHSCHVVD